MTKKLTKIVLAVALLFGAAQGVKAQVDVAFSQFYANPLYLNPAFAGSKVCPRVSLNYRSQWPSLVSAFTTVSASYDQYIDALHGGVGALLMTDRQGDHAALSTSSLAVMYAFRFQLAREVWVNAGLQAGITNTSLNWNELRFPDMIDYVNGFTGQTSAQIPEHTNKWFLGLQLFMVCRFLCRSLDSAFRRFLWCHQDAYKTHRQYRMSFQHRRRGPSYLVTGTGYPCALTQLYISISGGSSLFQLRYIS